MTECDHIFDGGYCLECGESQLCILCEHNDWQSGCDMCNDGVYLCSECYNSCNICENNLCVVCDQRSREEGFALLSL